jgi:hypothetical protein
LKERIQVSLKEGISLSPRGDNTRHNSKIVKIHTFLKEIFSRTSRPKSVKLGTDYPLVRRIHVLRMRTIQNEANYLQKS